MKVYVVLRNEPRRRCYLGVYATREAAEQFVRDDIESVAGGYEQTDYDIMESTVAGTPQESKFFKTTITLEILHDHPIDFGSMPIEDVVYHIQDGDCSGNWTVTKVEELNRAQMDEALVNAGSDAAFFDLGGEEED